MDANSVLAATLSPNQQERDAATEQLTQLLSSNPAAYLANLSQTLASDQAPSHIRNAAGLAIKNALSARDAARQDDYAARWKNLDPPTRDSVKHDALATLAAADRGARNVSGQVVAAVAAVELPAGMWPGLVGQLLQLASANDNPNLRQATLQTIGYICEAIVRDVSRLPLPCPSACDRSTDPPLPSCPAPPPLRPRRNPTSSPLSPTRSSPPSCRAFARRSRGASRPRSHDPAHTLGLCCLCPDSSTDRCTLALDRQPRRPARRHQRPVQLARVCAREL